MFMLERHFIVDIRNVTKSQMLPFSELHCDKGRLSQARHKPSLWGKGDRRRIEKIESNFCRKPDVLNFLLNGKKPAHPVEARLVDLVCRLRQSLGRGLAIFQTVDATQWAAFPTICSRRHILIFFLHTCTIRERATPMFVYCLSFLSLTSWRWWVFVAAPISGGGTQPQLLSHLQQALHDRRAADGIELLLSSLLFLKNILTRGLAPKDLSTFEFFPFGSLPSAD